MNRKPPMKWKGRSVFTGNTGFTTIMLACIVTMLLSPMAHAADVLRFTMSGYTGEVRITNPTSHAVQMPPDCTGSVCGPASSIPPYGTAYVTIDPGKADVFTTSYASSLLVATMMTDDHGSTITVPALTKFPATSPVHVQGFAAEVPWSSSGRKAYVFVSNAKSVDFYRDDQTSFVVTKSDGTKSTTNLDQGVTCPQGAVACFIPAPVGSNRAVINPWSGVTGPGFDGSFYAGVAQFDSGGVQEWLSATPVQP